VQDAENLQRQKDMTLVLATLKGLQVYVVGMEYQKCGSYDNAMSWINQGYCVEIRILCSSASTIGQSYTHKFIGDNNMV